MIKFILCVLVLLFFTVTRADTVTPVRDPFTKSTEIQSIIPVAAIVSLKTCWIPLYFAQAKNIVSFISKKSSAILSPLGKINYDKRSNQIWLKDDKQHIAAIRALINHLDQSGPQFLIKAKIINLDRQYQKTLGVLFQTQDATKNSQMSLSMDQPDSTDAAGQFTLTIAKLAESRLLDLQISALEQEGHASLISSPALMTLDNQAAVIQSGAEVPYQEMTLSGGTSVSFKKAVLRLKVTPKQMPNGHILLHISLNQDKVSALTVKGVPAIQTQQITTQVVVKNHQTIVLGGILETTHANQKEGLPIADKLPIVGELFTHHTSLTKQQELLIFITPSEMKALS
ncbi:MAG: secretin [Gammaproteobacteria bacterium]|nr:secretin [Gammaproteobacteria bacterium]